MKRSDLHNYQLKAVSFVEDHAGSALFISMGLGKTIITLTAIADLINWCEVSRVLVIAPKKVAEATWSEELSKWEHLSFLRASLILGDKKHRDKALADDAEIYVTSRDLFPKIAEPYIKHRDRWPFDMVVIDELTSFKSHSAKRWKMFKKLRPFMSRVVGLTGTPTPNGLKDLWGQMMCIDLGRSLGHRYTDFIDRYFDTYRVNNIPVRMTLKPEALGIITKLIEDSVLTMKAADYLELPPLIEHTIRVTWPEDLRKQYERFEEECVLEFNEDEAPLIVASNAAVLAGKLLQFCNGAIYDEDHNVTLIHDRKLEAAMQIIETAYEEGDGVLLFYEFQHDKDRILKAAEALGMRCRIYAKPKDLEDWNAGLIDLLITHPASTAYGLNLQQGGHIIVWYGTGWNAELYLQGNARLHRQGQEAPTIVYRVVMAGSMDEAALHAVESKVDGQNAVVEALKALKRDRLGR